MDNAVAWHWASCDAGVGIIPRFSQQKIKLVSRPMAERYGIAKVKWRLAGDGPEFVAQPIDVKKFSGLLKVLEARRPDPSALRCCHAA